MHSKHMKRTNLVLDEKVLNQVMHISQKRTYSDAVMLAMKEYIRANEFSQIFQFQGSGIWEGNLSKMRKDSNNSLTRKKK
jgi:hypothetical protein